MTPPRSSSSRVYIGHCKADELAARRLAVALRDQHGIDVWLADWEVGLGEVIVAKHDEAIVQAEIALLVFSRAGLDDAWMRQQYAAMMTQAVEREGRLVIPVLDGIAHEQLPPFLAIRRSAPITAVEAIAAALGKHLGHEPSAVRAERRPVDQYERSAGASDVGDRGTVADEALFDELARVYWRADETSLVVLQAGFPRPHVPNFTTPTVFWSRVKQALQDGMVADGVRALADAAAKSYPSNVVFAGYRRRAGRATGVATTRSGGEAGSAPTTRTASAPEDEAAPSTSVIAAELTTYRDAVRQRYGVNRFIGFTSPFECELAWEELYVDLVMDKAHGHTKGVRSTEPEPEPKDVREAEGTKVSLDEAFAYAHDHGRRALVMLGDPGSGKTTQLQQVLLWVLDESRGPTSLNLPEDTVPVFVALQEFPKAIEALGADAEFEALVAWAAAKRLRMPGISAPLVDRLLQSPRVLYLLDGLDEIPDSTQRERVSRMIVEALVDGPPEHHMLVSSRYAGYSDVKRVHLGNAFLELKLRPLDDEQVEHLVHNWHRAVENRDVRAQGRPALENDAKHRGEALLLRIRAPEFAGEDRLQAMARTPLLLTALCLIDRERRRKGELGLPRDRGAIYQECEEILLEQWQREARRRPPSLDAEVAGRILQPVAYWLHGEQQRRYATLAELRAPVAEGLAALGKAEETAEGFVRSFTSESGLLTPWGPRQYGFVHLGFQEHLAALHVRERWAGGEAGLVRALASRFGEGWWREVIRLTLVGAEAGLIEEFMRAVTQHSDFGEWSHMRLMSLCLRGPAGPAGARALVEVLRTPAGAEQHSAALRLLMQQVPQALEGQDAWLREHPTPEVRRRWLTRTRWNEVGRTKVDPKSGVKLVWIPGGWFTMGSATDDDQAWDDETPAHEVELSGFWLGRTPVTNAQYRRFLEDPQRDPSVKEPEGWGDSDYNQPQQPVVGVSWEEAQAYCKWAGLSLPTEAQWEYACRGGTTTRYHSGDSEEDLARVGWYGGNSGDRLHAVGELEPNPLGLYDMHGNVEEWCQDTWVGNYEGAVHQPGGGLGTQPVGDSSRVVRGGDFNVEPRPTRSAYRSRYEPSARFGWLGFRVAQGHSE